MKTEARFPIVTKLLNGMLMYEWPHFDNEFERVNNFYLCHPHLFCSNGNPKVEKNRLILIGAEQREIDAADRMIEKWLMNPLLKKMVK